MEYSPVRTSAVKKGPDFQRATGRKSFFENTTHAPGPGDYNLASKVSINTNKINKTYIFKKLHKTKTQKNKSSTCE